MPTPLPVFDSTRAVPWDVVIVCAIVIVILLWRAWAPYVPPKWLRRQEVPMERPREPPTDVR